MASHVKTAQGCLSRKRVLFGISDVGLKRANSEDNFMVADLTRAALGVKANRVVPEVICHVVGDKGTLLAVAGGRGGRDDGEIASRVAVEALVETLLSLEAVAGPRAEQFEVAVQTSHPTICRERGGSKGSRRSSTWTTVHVGRIR